MFYRTITGLILSAISLPSNAINLTIGASFGGFKYDSDKESTYVTENKSTFSLIGQYALRENFNIELSLNDLGEYTINTLPTEYSALAASIIAETSVFDGFQPYAKLGYGFMTMTQKLELFGTEIESKTVGDTLLAGVGIGYKSEHLPNFSFRASYDYYYFKTSQLRGTESYNNNLSGFSLSLLYHLD